MPYKKGELVLLPTEGTLGEQDGVPFEVGAVEKYEGRGMYIVRSWSRLGPKDDGIREVQESLMQPLPKLPELLDKAYDKAPTVNAKYRVLLEGFGLDGDHFYDQRDEEADTREKQDAFFQFGPFSEWETMENVDPEGKLSEESRDEAVRKARHRWVPEGTVRMMEIPVGRVCNSCGGSEVLLLCLDAEGNVLKGKAVDFG